MRRRQGRGRGVALIVSTRVIGARLLRARVLGARPSPLIEDTHGAIVPNGAEISAGSLAVSRALG